MTDSKTLLPQFEEQQFLNQATKIEQIQEILNKFSQLVPANFIKIELEVGNYCGSTNPKWKNKPLSERYGFEYRGKWIQLDIPHSLFEKLNLKKGEDLTVPFYLSPEILKKEPTYGGITLQEGEIILVNPRKIVMKDQGVQTEPNIEGFNKLKEELETQQQNYLELERQKQGEIAELRNQLNEKEQELNKWTNQFPSENATQVHARINLLNSQLNTSNAELEKREDAWLLWKYETTNLLDTNDLGGLILIPPKEGEKRIVISGRKISMKKEEIYEFFRNKVYQYYLDEVNAIEKDDLTEQEF